MAECLKEDSPDSMKATALSAGSVFYKAYNEFLYSVQTGERGFTKAYGMGPFEYFGLPAMAARNPPLHPPLVPHLLPHQTPA